jgi:hypothetical protein
MRCAEARDALMASLARPSAEAGAAPAAAAVTDHLAGCASCSAFAARLAAYRTALPGATTDVVPGPGFSARVVARLPDDVELLGWAALRLMPAALVLALACSWYGVTHGPGLSDLLLAEGDPQLLTYVAVGPESPLTDPAAAEAEP